METLNLTAATTNVQLVGKRLSMNEFDSLTGNESNPGLAQTEGELELSIVPSELGGYQLEYSTPTSRTYGKKLSTIEKLMGKSGSGQTYKSSKKYWEKLGDDTVTELLSQARSKFPNSSDSELLSHIASDQKSLLLKTYPQCRVGTIVTHSPRLSPEQRGMMDNMKVNGKEDEAKELYLKICARQLTVNPEKKTVMYRTYIENGVEVKYPLFQIPFLDVNGLGNQDFTSETKFPIAENQLNAIAQRALSNIKTQSVNGPGVL